MIVFLSARLPPLYRSLTAASNSSLVTMLTRLIPPSARLPSREQLRRGNCHDSAAALARQSGSHLDCRRPQTLAIVECLRMKKACNTRPARSDDQVGACGPCEPPRE